MRALPFVFLLLFGAASLAPSPAEALRCSNRIVVEGDSAVRVRRLCGDPQAISRRQVERTRAVRRAGPDGIVVVDVVTVVVELEVWLYDFGPRRFTRELLFEEARLVDVVEGGYGTDPD
jgi:hypothetical protein